MGVASTLQGHRVTSARVWLPAWGCWFAEVMLDGEHALSGRVTLSLAGLALVGTVLSGGAEKGRSSFRIVSGAGGWGRQIPAASESDDAGVKLSKVLLSAASACGETLDASTLPTTRVGPSYARREDQACRVLELEVPGAWYVGEDGITRIGRRGASTIAASVPRVSTVDLARRTVTLAPESASGLVPGVTVDGIEAVDVQHELGEDGLRTTVYGSRDGGGSRRLAALRQIFDQMAPDLKFAGVTEYRVVLLAGTTRVDLQPVRRSSGMPDLRRVPMMPGVAGAKSTLALGSRVLVAFVDSDPARPVVVGFEDADGAGFTPTLTTIDAATFVRLGAGARPAIGAGDLAGGIWPCVPTQVKVVI